MIISEKAKSNSAFYYEVCMLKILSAMGYLNEKYLGQIINLKKVTSTELFRDSYKGLKTKLWISV